MEEEIIPPPALPRPRLQLRPTDCPSHCLPLSLRSFPLPIIPLYLLTDKKPLACVAGAKRGGGGGRDPPPNPPPLFPFLPIPYPLPPTPFDACYAG